MKHSMIIAALCVFAGMTPALARVATPRAGHQQIKQYQRIAQGHSNQTLFKGEMRRLCNQQK